MGRVYLAKQTDLGRQVVVKVMHDHVASDPKFRERFQREMLLMARFQHPYVVALYDASLSDPLGPCIVMEYVRGISLDTLMHRNGRLSPARVGRMLGQLCEALYAAHSEGIIHRDLKPANLMVVDPDTPYEKIKVMDFGLAKLLNHNDAKKVPGSGAEFAVGTPGYMCPEQARGDEMDHRGDIYSVGVILFELLTGQLPFSGRSTMDTLLAHATEAPPSFADAGAGDWVPAGVEQVVLSCLAKHPSGRPSSGRDLADRYEMALLQQSTGDNAPPAPPPSPGSSRNDTPSPAIVLDPNAVVHHLEAWMPETIAAYKLRGFVEDVGGEVLESVPGRIKVRVGGRGSVYAPAQRFGWLGLGKKTSPIDMELVLERAESGRDNLLHITVQMRPLPPGNPHDPEWRGRCSQIYCDLRGYLMGNNNKVE